MHNHAWPTSNDDEAKASKCLNILSSFSKHIRGLKEKTLDPEPRAWSENDWNF